MNEREHWSAPVPTYKFCTIHQIEYASACTACTRRKLVEESRLKDAIRDEIMQMLRNNPHILLKDIQEAALALPFIKGVLEANPGMEQWIKVETGYTVKTYLLEKV